jgi:small subunit ribosomal protein S20
LANIKSQIKRIRTSEAQRQRNKAVRSALKTHIGKFRAAVEAADKEAAKTALAGAIKQLDSAAAKGVIHKNNAANKKSALTKTYNALA